MRAFHVRAGRASTDTENLCPTNISACAGVAFSRCATDSQWVLGWSAVVIGTQRCRDVLGGNVAMTDADIEDLRDLLYELAMTIVESDLHVEGGTERDRGKSA